MDDSPEKLSKPRPLPIINFAQAKQLEKKYQSSFLEKSNHQQKSQKKIEHDHIPGKTNQAAKLTAKKENNIAT